MGKRTIDETAVAIDFASVRTIVCDLDGVVYLGEEGIRGAGDALRALDSAGLELLFVTNNSSKSAADVVDKIVNLTGYPVAAQSVVTSTDVTAAQLAGLVDSAYVVGSKAIEEALAAVGIATTADWRHAGAVVVGLDRDVTYDRLAAATQAIRRGALFYATNTDSTYPTPEGLLPGGGVMAGALQIATDRVPVVAGKPSEEMANHVAALASGPILAVGDRPETDVAMANAAGWASVLVLSGVTASLEEVPTAYTPDLVIPALRDLPALFEG